MAWDYAPTINGDHVAAAVDLDDYAEKVLVLTEWGGGRRGRSVTVVGRHGAVRNQRPFFDPRLLLVEVVARETNSAGAVTHPDGRAGHTKQNLAELDRLFFGARGPITFTRTIPDPEGVGGGEVVFVEGDVFDEPQVGRLDWSRIYSIRVDNPFWNGAAFSGVDPTSGGGHNPGGSAPVADFVVNFQSGTDQRLTFSDFGDYVEFEGAAPGAGGVDINMRTGKATRVSDSADLSKFAKSNRRWYCELIPGVANPATLTGGGTVTISGRTKWLS